MKKTNALLLLTIVYGLALIIILPPSIRASTAGDAIQSIRNRYATINKNIKRYRKVDKELSGYSTEGGSLIAYFDGVTIKKITAQFYGEMGRTEEDYYYWNGKLIFVFRTEYRYSEPLSGKVVSTEESRFYFDNGRMIRWLNERGRQVPSSTASYKEKQDEYLKTSRELTDLARAPEHNRHCLSPT